MGPPKRRTKQRVINTCAFGGYVSCLVLSTRKDNWKVALLRDLAGRIAQMCASIIRRICQWTCWCNMPSERVTSVVYATRNKEMRKTYGPRPFGYVAFPGRCRGNM